MCVSRTRVTCQARMVECDIHTSTAQGLAHSLLKRRQVWTVTFPSFATAPETRKPTSWQGQSGSHRSAASPISSNGAAIPSCRHIPLAAAPAGAPATALAAALVAAAGDGTLCRDPLGTCHITRAVQPAGRQRSAPCRPGEPGQRARFASAARAVSAPANGGRVLAGLASKRPARACGFAPACGALLHLGANRISAGIRYRRALSSRSRDPR